MIWKRFFDDVDASQLRCQRVCQIAMDCPTGRRDQIVSEVSGKSVSNLGGLRATTLEASRNYSRRFPGRSSPKHMKSLIFWWLELPETYEILNMLVAGAPPNI